MNKVAQFLVLAVGGAGAFVVAMQWSRLNADAAGSEGGDVVQPATRVVAEASPARIDAPAPTPVRTAASELFVPATRTAPRPGGAAFDPLSWKPPAPPPPPPPAPVPPPPPPPPKAPPLPFTFVGMVERGTDRIEAYLAKGDALLIVGVGDEIDNKAYRVEALSPTGVVLTYLPMGLQQTVNAPGVKP